MRLGAKISFRNYAVYRDIQRANLIITSLHRVSKQRYCLAINIIAGLIILIAHIAHSFKR